VNYKISVASGKGGTGKTTVAVALALALRNRVENVQLLDCDVEEPNAALLLRPKMNGGVPVTLRIPRVDLERCTGCGECCEVCRYNAVAVVNQKALIFENLCHACGGCVLACPEKAISEKDKVIGKIETGDRDNIDFLRGILNVGEPMATPVVRMLKSRARDNLLTILDAPPGTACPVIATVQDSDYCILVTEPTPFGLYDLDLMFKVVTELGIPAGIVINKDDGLSQDIEAYASKNDIRILMRIPLDRGIAVRYSKGFALNSTDKHWDTEFLRLYEKVVSEICRSQSR
jgi:MinD superfamily P-loop ATPase